MCWQHTALVAKPERLGERSKIGNSWKWLGEGGVQPLQRVSWSQRAKVSQESLGPSETLFCTGASPGCTNARGVSLPGSKPLSQALWFARLEKRTEILVDYHVPRNSQGNNYCNCNYNLAANIILKSIIYVIVSNSLYNGNRGTCKKYFARQLFM